MIYFTAVAFVLLVIYYFWRSRRNRDLFASIQNEAVFQKNCKQFNLSAREVEVLRLVLQGMTYAQVADRLYISKKTVDSHIQHIYVKLDVSNKLELIQKLYRV